MNFDFLVGEWSCDVYHVSGYNDGSTVTGWVNDSEGLSKKLSSAVITYVSDGDGTYSLTTSTPNPFVCNSTSAQSSPYKVISNLFYYKY